MLALWSDPDVVSVLFGPPAKHRSRATQVKTLLAASVIILLLVLGLITKASASDGMIYDSSGTCRFSKEPEPCEHYISPCVKGAEYFYFPSQGVLRTRDNGIVEVET
jgi:hypothetical protein